MSAQSLNELQRIARGPLGPAADVDFGRPDGPLKELGNLLSGLNGFFAFNGGVQLFRVGSEGMGPDLETWNDPATWKYTYQGLVDDVFCFGQDLFGFQFGIVGGRDVVVIDPETADRETLGTSLHDWAAWLLADPDGNGRATTARAWNESNGPLDVGDRLIHRQLLILGGENSWDNIVAKDAVTCMRVRGPIAVATHDLPAGAEVRLDFQ